MRKNFFYLKFIFLFFALCFFILSCEKEEHSDFFNVPELKEKSAEIILMINEKSWDEIRELSTNEFKKIFNEDFIKLNTKLFFEPAGEYMFIRNTFYSEAIDKLTGEKIGIVFIQVKHKNKNLCYIFNYNEEKKLIGFFIK